MKHRVHNSPNLLYSVGTQVVASKQVQGTNGRAVHSAGAVGVIVRAPPDRMPISLWPASSTNRKGLNSLGQFREFFQMIARTFGRSDTLIEVNRNFCPGMGYSSTEDDSNDALKTKTHTLIADHVTVLQNICSTGE